MSRSFTTPDHAREPVVFHVTRQKLHGDDIVELRHGHHERMHLTSDEAAKLAWQIWDALGTGRHIVTPDPTPRRTQLLAADGEPETELPTTVAEQE